MKGIHGFSVNMEDLTTEQGRRDAEAFFEYVLWRAARSIHEAVPYKKVVAAAKPKQDLRNKTNTILQGGGVSGSELKPDTPFGEAEGWRILLS